MLKVGDVVRIEGCFAVVYMKAAGEPVRVLWRAGERPVWRAYNEEDLQPWTDLDGHTYNVFDDYLAKFEGTAAAISAIAVV